MKYREPLILIFLSLTSLASCQGGGLFGSNGRSSLTSFNNGQYGNKAGSNSDDGQYRPSYEGQYYPSGDEGQYHPTDEGRYIPDDSGAYREDGSYESSNKGSYYPSNEGQYTTGNFGQYIASSSGSRVEGQHRQITGSQYKGSSGNFATGLGNKAPSSAFSVFSSNVGSKPSTNFKTSPFQQSGPTSSKEYGTQPTNSGIGGPSKPPAFPSTSRLGGKISTFPSAGIQPTPGQYGTSRTQFSAISSGPPGSKPSLGGTFTTFPFSPSGTKAELNRNLPGFTAISGPRTKIATYSPITSETKPGGNAFSSYTGNGGPNNKASITSSFLSGPNPNFSGKTLNYPSSPNLNGPSSKLPAIPTFSSGPKSEIGGKAFPTGLAFGGPTSKLPSFSAPKSVEGTLSTFPTGLGNKQLPIRPLSPSPIFGGKISTFPTDSRITGPNGKLLNISPISTLPKSGLGVESLKAINSPANIPSKPFADLIIGKQPTGTSPFGTSGSYSKFPTPSSVTFGSKSELISGRVQAFPVGSGFNGPTSKSPNFSSVPSKTTSALISGKVSPYPTGSGIDNRSSRLKYEPLNNKVSVPSSFGTSQLNNKFSVSSSVPPNSGLSIGKIPGSGGPVSNLFSTTSVVPTSALISGKTSSLFSAGPDINAKGLVFSPVPSLSKTQSSSPSPFETFRSSSKSFVPTFNSPKSELLTGKVAESSGYISKSSAFPSVPSVPSSHLINGKTSSFPIEAGINTKISTFPSLKKSEPYSNKFASIPPSLETSRSSSQFPLSPAISFAPRSDLLNNKVTLAPGGFASGVPTSKPFTFSPVSAAFKSDLSTGKVSSFSSGSDINGKIPVFAPTPSTQKSELLSSKSFSLSSPSELSRTSNTFSVSSSHPFAPQISSFPISFETGAKTSGFSPVTSKPTSNLISGKVLSFPTEFQGNGKISVFAPVPTIPKLESLNNKASSPSSLFGTNTPSTKASTGSGINRPAGEISVFNPVSSTLKFEPFTSKLPVISDISTAIKSKLTENVSTFSTGSAITKPTSTFPIYSPVHSVSAGPGITPTVGRNSPTFPTVAALAGSSNKPTFPLVSESKAPLTRKISTIPVVASVSGLNSKFPTISSFGSTKPNTAGTASITGGQYRPSNEGKYSPTGGGQYRPNNQGSYSPTGDGQYKPDNFGNYKSGQSTKFPADPSAPVFGSLRPTTDSKSPVISGQYRPASGGQFKPAGSSNYGPSVPTTKLPIIPSRPILGNLKPYTDINNPVNSNQDRSNNQGQYKPVGSGDDFRGQYKIDTSTNFGSGTPTLKFPSLNPSPSSGSPEFGFGSRKPFGGNKGQYRPDGSGSGTGGQYRPSNEGQYKTDTSKNLGSGLPISKLPSFSPSPSFERSESGSSSRNPLVDGQYRPSNKGQYRPDGSSSGAKGQYRPSNAGQYRTDTSTNLGSGTSISKLSPLSPSPSFNSPEPSTASRIPVGDGRYRPTNQGQYRPDGSSGGGGGQNRPSGEGQYKPNNLGNYGSVGGQYRPTGDSQYRPSGEGQYKPNNAGNYASTGGQYRPTGGQYKHDNSGSYGGGSGHYVHDESGKYVHDDRKYEHQDVGGGKYKHQPDSGDKYRPDNSGGGGYIHQPDKGDKYRPDNSGGGGYKHQPDPSDKYRPDNSGGGKYTPEKDNSGQYTPEKGPFGKTPTGPGSKTGGNVPTIYGPDKKTPTIPSNFGPQGSENRGSDVCSYESLRNYKIIRQKGELHQDNYHYLYETENCMYGEERGKLYNQGQEDEIMRAEGIFYYVGPDKVKYTVTYTADENGFIPHGDHIPTPPPIPAAILRSLEYQKSKGVL